MRAEKKEEKGRFAKVFATIIISAKVNTMSEREGAKKNRSNSILNCMLMMMTTAMMMANNELMKYSEY